MKDTGLSLPLDAFFQLSGWATRRFPRLTARVLDAVAKRTLGNGALQRHLERRNREVLRRIPSFQKILVISDIHIGDAVMTQTALSALRDFFPDAKIDYMVKRSMAGLLEGHPDASGVWGAFTGSFFPNEADLQNVQEMSVEYDVVFNFCPFFGRKLFPEGSKVLHFTDHAPVFFRNETEKSEPNHFSYQAYRFIHRLFSPFLEPSRRPAYGGTQVLLSPEARTEAGHFLQGLGLSGERPLVFLNPDTASPFTRISFRWQVELLDKMADLPCEILLGAGHSEKGIEGRLLGALPPWKRERIRVIPADLSLETYTALIDSADLFLSGDTGPLHLGAARKVDRLGRFLYRNRTSIFSVFGATPPRFSGYDSRQPGFLAASQEAPCNAYASQSACRNLTCVHKMVKTCDAKGCFDFLDVKRIVGDIQASLGKRRAVFSPGPA